MKSVLTDSKVSLTLQIVRGDFSTMPSYLTLKNMLTVWGRGEGIGVWNHGSKVLSTYANTCIPSVP